MRKYILHIASLVTACLISSSVWGDDKSGNVGAVTISTAVTWNLTADITLTGEITINNGGSLTITGNGKTITAYTGDGSAARTTFVVQGGGILSINNAIVTGGNSGTIGGNVGEADVQEYPTFTKSGRFIYLENTAKVYLTDVTAQYLYSVNKDVVPFVQLTGTKDGTSRTNKGLLKMERCTVKHCLNRIDNGIIHQSGGDMHADIDIDNSHITNCVILANNTGTGYGGVIKGAGSTACYLTMDNSTMEYCWSSGWGGAVLWAASGGGCKAIFTGCTFKYNYARYLGGAISSESTVELEDCTLSNNVAGYGGGALAAFPFTLTQTEGVADNSTAIGLKLTNNTINNNETLYATNYNGANVPANIRAKETDGTAQGVHLQLNGYFNPRYTLLNATDIYYPTGGGAIWVLMNKDGWNCSLEFGSNDIYNNTSASNAGGIFLFKQQPYRRANEGESEYVANAERAKIISDYSIVDGNRTGVTSMTLNATVYSNTASQNGGGVAVGASQVNSASWTLPSVILNGGSIYSNKAVDGAGIYMPGGAFTVNGGSVYSNTASNNGGGVYLSSGTVTISASKSFESYSNTAKSGGGIFMGGGTFTVNGTASFTKNKALKPSEYSGECNGGAVYLTNGTFTVGNNGTLNIGSDASDSGNSASDNGGGIYCGGTFTVNGNTKIKYNSANNGGAVYVSGANLTTTGTADVQHNFATADGGAFYVTNGKVTMANPSLKNNGKSGDNKTVNGGALYVTGSGAGFIASGTAQIQKNAASGLGGAIYVNGGNVNLAANTISSNVAGTGGAIYLKDGNIETTAASEITGNTSSVNGGAFYVDGGTVTLKTPTISSNSTTGTGDGNGNGGAVYVTGTGAGFTVTEGKAVITSNSATGNGGALFVSGGGVTLLDNEISGNSAKNGGVFYVSNGNISTQTSEITGNSASADGGVFFVNTGNIYLGKGSGNNQNYDVNLSGNNAVNGGAIALYNGVFSLSDNSFIKNNTATGNGGGLYVVNSGAQKTISCTGGEFSQNSAKLGGGIYANGDIVLTFAANVSENSANNGGGLYIDGGTQLSFGNGLIIKNSANKENEQPTTTGIGGGIYLNKGTLSFTEQQNLGIYNNVAGYEAADIFSSGTETTVNLPYVGSMNLTGFDVPGSTLYWVRDFNSITINGHQHGRYEAALLNLNEDIEEMILAFSDAEVTAKKKVVTERMCLDLGYDLVYVGLEAIGLGSFNEAEVRVYYTRSGNPVLYRTVVMRGPSVSYVGLPTGNWRFEVTSWTYKHDQTITFKGSPIAVDNTTNISDPIEFTRQTLLDNGVAQNVKFTFEIKHDGANAQIPNVIESSARVINRMSFDPNKIGTRLK